LLLGCGGVIIPRKSTPRNPVSPAIPVTRYEVNLTWYAPLNSPVPVAGYTVYRTTSGNTSYQKLNESVVDQTSYLDQNIQSGESYDYVVVSVDASGNTSIPSNIATTVIP
jgi:fibronectin type 3 domain-containing protein